MAWIELTPTARARRWQDDQTGQIHVSALCGVPVAYESTLDSGRHDTPVNFTPQRVTAGGNDGWRITANGFHYFLGQPAGRATDGWVGFGGRQGQHWLSFRMLRAGYLHWPTRAWEDVSGTPTYTRAGRLTRTNMSRTLGPQGAQVTQVLENVAQWSGIWSTPGGGDVTIRWRVNGRGLKEEIVLNEAARNWIAANRAPATPASETWFGFAFQVDWSDIPRVLRGGLLQSVEDDFDDTGGIRLESALNELLAFMPLDHAYVDTTVDMSGFPRSKREYLPLRKRIYKDGSDYILLVGARVDELNALPAGDVVFDPTFIVAETNEDGYSEGTNENVLPTQGSFPNSLGYYDSGAGPVDGGWIFRSTGIGSGDTIDTATLNLEYAGDSNGLPLNGSLFGFNVDSPTDFNNAHTHRISDHEAGGRTTASVAANIGSAADYTSASLVSILQEIVNRAGFAGDLGLCWRQAGTALEWWDWRDYTHSAVDAAELTVTFTPAGGTTFEETMSGAITPTGAVLRQSQKPFIASITPTGTLTRLADKTLAGSITPQSTLSRLISKLFTGSLTPTGALTAVRTVVVSFSGSLIPTGVLSRLIDKLPSGSFTPTGAVFKQIGKPFAGDLMPSGVLAILKTIARSFSGNITPIGALTRQIEKTFSGALSSAAALVRQTQKNFAGGITPTGALTILKAIARSFTGSLTPTGALLRQTVKTYAGTITPAGALFRQAQKVFTGSVTPAGILSVLKTIARDFSGNITPIGALGKQISKTLSGVLTPIGTLLKSILKSFTGSIAPSGVLTALRTVIIILTGAITPTGALIRQTNKLLSGSLASAGTITKQISKILSGILASAGALIAQLLGLTVPPTKEPPIIIDATLLPMRIEAAIEPATITLHDAVIIALPDLPMYYNAEQEPMIA